MPQFKHNISVVYNTYDGFGQEVTTDKINMKCTIVKHNKYVTQTTTKKTRDYDLKLITSYKRFSPYKDLVTDDTLTFVYNGTEYRILVVSEINDFSGRTRYVEIQLEEKK